MLRGIRRWFSTDETQALARDVDAAADRILTLGHAVEGLQRRIDRHLNKLQMRDSRRGRGEVMELSEEEQRVLDDLRAQGGNGGRDPFGV